MKLLLILLVLGAMALAVFTPIAVADRPGLIETPATDVDPNALYFKETNFWIVNYAADGTPIGFVDEFKTVPFRLIGYPISGATLTADGTKIVQLFQRARMEYQLKGGYITYGLLGSEAQSGPPPVVVTQVQTVYQDSPATLQALSDARQEIDRINSVNLDVVGRAQAILLQPGKADNLAGFMEFAQKLVDAPWGLSDHQKLTALHRVIADARGGADYLTYDQNAVINK